MPEPIRVAFTLEQCWHDVPGGSAVAAVELARRLDRDESVDLVGVAGRHRRPAPEPYRPPVPVRSLPIARPVLYETWNRFGWPGVESVTGVVDVCHSTVAIPAVTSAPHVVTVHDVAFVHSPERFTAHGVAVMRRGLERCRTADLVACPSRATANDLVALGFDAGRIRVVPWGVERRRVDDSDLERVRRLYSLPDRFVVFVGTVEPRKNLRRLAEAMEAVPGVDLVVVGAPGWGEAVPARAGTRFVGFVPDGDLRPILQAATVLAYPSLAEGFGFPILEAMVQGTAVVTSSGSSTGEIAGDAAVLADPTDVGSITAAVRAALADPERWAAAGRERAAEFTWEASAEAMTSVYREAARR